MSRTYRKKIDWDYYAHGRYWTWDEVKELPLGATHGWHGHYRLLKKSRDKKAWDKPPKAFKQMKRRQERARVKDAMAKDRELPRFRKSDAWEWT